MSRPNRTDVMDLGTAEVMLAFDKEPIVVVVPKNYDFIEEPILVEKDMEKSRMRILVCRPSLWTKTTISILCPCFGFLKF